MSRTALAPATHSARTTLPARFRAGAGRWWRSYREKRLMGATIRALQSLDNRALKDIGLDRSEIESVAIARCCGRRLRYVEFGGR